MIDDQSDEPKLDYYVDDEIKLLGLTSLKEKDGTIEMTGVAAISNETELEEKSEPVPPPMELKSVKLTSVSHEDVKRVLALARKVALAPRLRGPQEEKVQVDKFFNFAEYLSTLLGGLSLPTSHSRISWQ